MTEPAPVPPLDPYTSLAWCSACGVHYATLHRPLCPVCISLAAEEAQR